VALISQDTRPFATHKRYLTYPNPCHSTRNRSGAVVAFTRMAASTCLPLHSGLHDADLYEGQRQLPRPSSSIPRHEASKTGTPPNQSVVRQPSESRTIYKSRASHDASSAEDRPHQSRKTVRQAEGDMGQHAKTRLRGESDLSRSGPKIKLSTSNGSAFDPIAESSSSFSPQRYAEFKVMNLRFRSRLTRVTAPITPCSLRFSLASFFPCLISSHL
jgi:hypothetical protein